MISRVATPAAASSLPLRIFLSSTSEDLIDHRKAVVEAIHGLGQLPVYMETFGAGPEDPLVTCRKLAKTADAIVVIVGHRYGHVPNSEAAGGDGKNMVRHEVEAAAEAGKPLFCYFAEETETLNDLGKKEDRERLAELRRFLNDLKAVIYDRFSSPDDLAKRVAIALGKWVFRDQARDFATALRLIDLGAHPNLPETLRTKEFLPVPLLDHVLDGSKLPSEELDRLIKGEQLLAAQKNLAESLTRNQKEASALKERLNKFRAQERELSARIELLERERPPTSPVPPTYSSKRSGVFDFARDPRQLQQQREAYETALLYYKAEKEVYDAQLEDFDRRRASLRLDRLQLEGARQSAEETEISLRRLQQEGDSERRRLEGESAAARAKDIVHPLQKMRDQVLRLLEEPGRAGEGFLLLLLTVLATSVLNRHLAGHASEAAWADRIAEKLSGEAEEAVRRDPQALGRDSLALAVALREGLKKGERTTAEVRWILDSVPAEALQRFSLEQQRLLCFVSPRSESFETLLAPDSIAEAAEKVERQKVELVRTLDAIRALETEAAAFRKVTEESKRRADRLRRRWSQSVDSLLPRLDDCTRVWTLLKWAAESRVLRGEARRFCACLRMEVEADRRLGETPEALVARCKSRIFDLPKAEAAFTKHPVIAYLAREEELRRRLPELETRAEELDRASRTLAELPRRRVEEYRQGLRFAALLALVPWLGLAGASEAGVLVRHFAPALRSDHPGYRNLPRWSLPWLYGAALVSTLGAISLGFAIHSILAGTSLLWATVLALSALGYFLGSALWITQTVRVLIFEVKRARAERWDRKKEAERRRLEAKRRRLEGRWKK